MRFTTVQQKPKKYELNKSFSKFVLFRTNQLWSLMGKKHALYFITVYNTISIYRSVSQLFKWINSNHMIQTLPKI